MAVSRFMAGTGAPVLSCGTGSPIRDLEWTI